MSNVLWEVRSCMINRICLSIVIKIHLWLWYSLYSWEQSCALFKTNGNLILIEQWTSSLDEFHLMKRLTTFPNPTLFVNNILRECVYHFIFILLGLYITWNGLIPEASIPCNYLLFFIQFYLFKIRKREI